MLGFRQRRVKHPATQTLCPTCLLGYVMGFSGIHSTSVFEVSDIALFYP